MEPVPSTRPSRTRGRVVMLVDNGVVGDSRVQKSARSAAEAGWDVILIGILGSATVANWHIGDAEVRLVPVPSRVTRPIAYRRSLLRRPLAYPPGPKANARIQAMKAWRKDIAFRTAAAKEAKSAGGAGGRGLVEAGSLAISRIALRVVARWAKFRAGELWRLRNNRQNADSPLNTIPIRFWQRVRGERSWRKLDPALWDYELAFGWLIDELKPDLIHAHDFRMIGVGVRATLRARAEGRPVKMVYDAHEFVPGITGRPTNPRWLPAQIAYEKEFIRYADSVITISPTLAELLQETHGLRQKPAVVLNAPAGKLSVEQEATPVPDLRALCGIDGDMPLLAYCGGINPVRGVDLIIDALPHLPGLHVALVSLHPNGTTTAADKIRARAEELGVTERVHILPYVPHWQVARFLAAADAAVSPLHHLLNHEIALSNKFFEYSQARLPLVVSDVRTMAEVVRATGQGEVFRAQDLDDYVRAVRAVLADPERYRAAYDKPGLLEQWTWEAQAEVLDGVYGRLLPERRITPEDEVAPVAGPASSLA